VSSLKKTEPLPWILTFTDLLQQALANGACRRAAAAMMQENERSKGSGNPRTECLGVGVCVCVESEMIGAWTENSRASGSMELGEREKNDQGSSLVSIQQG
jgi:hypothetical protein